MNYKRVYDLLIERGKQRQLDCYVERHHITPRCIGGLDDESNLVELTPEEHYVAHQLLVKIYPNDYRLARAAYMMTVGSSTVLRTNKLYGWLKRKFSEAQSALQSGKGNSNYGSRWASNGSESKMIPERDSLPEGWHWGRLTRVEEEERARKLLIKVEKKRVRDKIRAALQKQRDELHAVERQRELHRVYCSEGLLGLRQVGYTKSLTTLIKDFKKFLPEFVSQPRKPRNGKKTPQRTKSLDSTGICDDSWDLLFKLYNDSVLTLTRGSASKIAYRGVLALYPEVTLTFSQVKTLTQTYAKYGRTLKEHTNARSR